MAWTADDLVAAVRVRAQLPDAAGDGATTDANILTLANEEIALRLVPLVRRSRGDYFVSVHDVPVVSGVGAYRVPSRAQTSGLRDLSIVDSSGREWQVPHMHLEDAGQAQLVGGGYGSVRFYMQGPDVVLVPTPTYSDVTLRMRYHRSHAVLVPTSESMSVTLPTSSAALDAPITPVTLDDGTALLTVPPWAVGGGTYAIDVYWPSPPFGVEALDVVVDYFSDSPPTAQFIMDEENEAKFKTRDTWLMASRAGSTSVVDLPRECWALLVSAVTARVCEVIGDRDAASLAFGLYDRESQSIMTLLTPRVEGNKQVIVDRYSPLRGGRGRGWR